MPQFNHGGAKCIKIPAHVNNYNLGKLTMPVWQRNQQKIWNGDYQSELIQSILWGIVIPMIYFGKLIGTVKPIIIDGGHRTRTLVSFMKNEFSVRIGSDNVYYDTLPADTRGSRVLDESEKSNFDNYKLTTVCYEEITEKEARTIFNLLQNAVPMTMPDIINSFESDLVSWFRTFRAELLGEKENYKHLKGMKLPHPDTNGDLYQFLSWFTIINPPENSDKSDEENALENIEMGKDRTSKCFKFLQAFPDSTLTQEKMAKFRDQINVLISFLKENQKLCSSWAGDIPTFIYSDIYVDNFSHEKFKDILESVKRFKGLDEEQAKRCRAGQLTIGGQKQVERDDLNEEYGGDLEKWVKSRAQNPSGEKGMKIRNEIVKQWCVNDEEDVAIVSGDEIEEIESGDEY